MTKEEILRYIFDDFRIELEQINNVIILDNSNGLVDTGVKKIPHHRYELYFNPTDGTLFITPTEGLLRNKHIEVEVSILSNLTGRKINFQNCSKNQHKEKNLSKWFLGLNDRLRKKPSIKSILIGSMPNYNFLLRSHYEPGFLDDSRGRINTASLNDYIIHRAQLAVIEEEIFQERLLLDPDVTGQIYHEGKMPSLEWIEIAESIFNKIENCQTKLGKILSEKIYRDYWFADYVLFSTRENDSTVFQDTILSPWSIIDRNDLLSYQLIFLKDQTIINFSWSNPHILSEAIKMIISEYKIKIFGMYGKCGSMIDECKMGEIVQPVKTRYLWSELDINNQVLANKFKKLNFTCVDSPLLETKTWFKNEVQDGYSCLEMELYPIIRALTEKIKKQIYYYISDKPLHGINLSARYSFLQSRLACTKLALKGII